MAALGGEEEGVKALGVARVEQAGAAAQLLREGGQRTANS
jgi:hypothetical protein